ncbi:hypothetical protein QN277_017611 [Acacia crassicarpa]|uniref:Uncharacterized protein n=1 Tax=Acacia crassicarpa TaxID=499986 RepID=A0AAE1JRM2_9FABA|nr:hypothetical protein QN277_017611 [Acacia crassicarpa]
MVGGGSRRDEGSLTINNTNVFAALDALKKRKNKGSKSQVQSKPEPQVFWAPTPLNSKSWADVDDDEDDDYFATTAPPQPVWGGSEPEQSEEKPSYVEDGESEEDIFDEGDDEVEEEHDHEPEPSVKPEHEVKRPAEVSVAPKEAERQLSKKERKKKELAELEALLADFGVTQKENNGQDESRGVSQDKKDDEADGEKKENGITESKSAKKKKKKDKASKEVTESQDQPNVADTNNVGDEVAAPEKSEEDTSHVDVKERLKKVASIKKKKSSKEMDAAARAASQEAAARSARLAAAKKKEKNHYNRQPVR